jgi:hypothetical protein
VVSYLLGDYQEKRRFTMAPTEGTKHYSIEWLCDNMIQPFRDLTAEEFEILKAGIKLRATGAASPRVPYSSPRMAASCTTATSGVGR